MTVNGQKCIIMVEQDEKPLTGTSKVIAGGRITIDSAIRDALNIKEGDTVQYKIERVVKSSDTSQSHQ